MYCFGSANQYSWLVYFVAEYESRLSVRSLANMAFSEAYAYFRLSQGDGNCHCHKQLRDKINKHLLDLNKQQLRLVSLGYIYLHFLCKYFCWGMILFPYYVLDRGILSQEIGQYSFGSIL